MPIDYRHIKQYEKEILELKTNWLTLRKIREKLGFSYDQIHNFISRYNENQRKAAAGIAIKKKADHQRTMLSPSKRRLPNLNISSFVNMQKLNY